MVKTYAKGYRFERSLVHAMSKMGFVVMRAPRSGRIGLAAPDIVAIKQENGVSRILAIECKNRANGFSVSSEQLEELKEWKTKGGAQCYIAWKCGRDEPIFLGLDVVMKNKGNIGKKFAAKHGISLDEI